ncbi:hypothetical protein [Rossellomorea aquimaris]|nr:hypothetical protein [Rossellomorea aquimaris]
MHKCWSSSDTGTTLGYLFSDEEDKSLLMSNLGVNADANYTQ